MADVVHEEHALGPSDAADGGTRGAPALTRAELGALACILALGFALRWIGLGAGLWYDEIETLVRYVRQPLAHIVTTYDSQNQHLFYSVLARLSVVALGDG